MPDAPGDAADVSPPTLKLGSAGLKKDFLLTEASAAEETRRAKRSEDVLVIATAEDNESGVQSVSLLITIGIECGAAATNQTFSVSTPTQPASGNQPVSRSASYTISPATLRSGCAQTPASVAVSISAAAVNGAGKQSKTPRAIVSSYGPDTIRVATFNLFNPGNHDDSVYERWGRELVSLADIVVLNEVPDLRRANLVAQAAGLPYVAMMTLLTDTAILSRGPLSAQEERIINQPGTLLRTNDSYVFTVVTDIGRFPHRIIANNWGIRDNDQPAPPNQGSTGRLRAAQAVIELGRVNTTGAGGA